MLRYCSRRMQRLSYPARFALIGAVFVVALAYLTYGLYRSNQDSVDFSSKERLGVQYLQPAMSLLLAIEQAQTSAASGAKVADALQQQWQTLQQTHRALNAQLQLDTGWSALEAAWQKLQAAPQPANYQTMASRLLELSSMASDQSNLTLDPDIDTFYLMDILTVQWPAWLTHTTQANGLLQVSAGQALPAAARDQALGLAPQISESLKNMQHDLAKAIAYNASLKSVFAGLDDKLTAQAGVNAAELAKAIGGQAYRPAGLQAASLDVAGQFQQLALTQLGSLLDARIAGIQWQRDRYLICAGLALLVSSGLFIALYMSITAQLGGEPFYVQEIVEQIAIGRLDTSITLQENDDSSLLAAIRKMRNQLRATVTAGADLAATGRCCPRCSGGGQPGSQQQ